MALKGKTKKTQRHRPKPVARPPKAAIAKRSPDRRRLDLFLVIGALFVVTLVVAVVWALSIGDKPKVVPGLDEYAQATAQALEDTGNVADELADAARTVAAAQGGDALSGAFARSGGLTARIQTASDVLAAQSPQGTWASAASISATSLKILREGVAVLALAESSDPRAMQQQMASKSARLAAAASALRGVSQRDLDNLADSASFVEQASDFVQWPAPAGDVEAAPLLGILPELPASPGGGEPAAVDTTGEIGVSLDTQPIAEYGTVVGAALSGLDAATSNMGDVVGASQTTGDHAGLQLAATGWYQAARTAYVTLAGTPRPDKGGIEDVALLNSVWLLQESTRSFASASTDAAQANDLIENGKKLRILSDELRATATTGFAVAALNLAPAPASGFDPTLVGPAAPTQAPPGAATQAPGDPPPGAATEEAPVGPPPGAATVTTLPRAVPTAPPGGP